MAGIAKLSHAEHASSTFPLVGYQVTRARQDRVRDRMNQVMSKYHTNNDAPTNLIFEASFDQILKGPVYTKLCVGFSQNTTASDELH